MKSSHVFSFALLAFLAGAHAAPTEIARESFEGTPGAIGFTTSVAQFIETAFNPQSDFFSILPNNGTKISGLRTLPGADGASIFAAEDCDTPRTLPAVVGPQEVSLTSNAVNIAGKINTQVRLLMAAPGRSDGTTVTLGEYENFSNAPLFINKLKVEASIDGGPFQRVVQFSPTLVDVGGQQLSYDADGNNVGNDANPIPTNPTVLDATLREGIYSIPTGNTVAIRITLETDATGELIVFDNLRIFGESPATNPPVLAGVPAGNLVFSEGSAATAIAPAITVTDSDSANLTSASVVISQALVSSEDVLAATPSGAILAGDIVYTAATGTLTITRTASVATYQAVLRSVTYRNTNLVNPSTSVRRVAFLASDGTNSSNAPIRDINVVDNIVTQAIPFVESFETDGRGTRYSVEGGFSLPPSMFARVAPGAVSGLDGTFAFGVENVDDNSDFTELVTFNLNAAGMLNLTGTLRVAAGGGAVYDGVGTPDFLRVEVSADGGPFQNVLAFYSDAAAQGSMRQDTTPADGTNLGNGTLLTAALQTFTFNLPSANTLTVRIRAFTNIVGENILFDRLFVDGTFPPLLVTTAADNVAGSLRAAVATALAQGGPSTILFDPAVFNGEAADVITLSAGEIVISDAGGVTIDASNLPTGVGIDGGPGTNRLFRIESTGIATFLRLKMTGGNGGGGGTPANYGGAIHTQGELSLWECTLSGNTSGNVAGALFNQSPGVLAIERCTFSGNSAGGTGAIQHESTQPLIIISSTFANNIGGFESGAINANNRALTLIHCTITGNAVTNTGGPGGGGVRSTLPTNVTVRDSIISGNTDANTPGVPNITPGFTALGQNLVNHATPQLAPLGDYGGPTQTVALRPGSPARNTAPGGSETSDQRGFPIVAPAHDIGAYETGTFTNFNAFIWETLPAAATAPQHAPTFDFDGDGRPNVLEYATFTDGAVPGGSTGTTFVRVPDGSEARFTFLVRTTATDLLYELQRSLPGVGPWVTIGDVNLRTSVIHDYGIGVTHVPSLFSIEFRDPGIAGQGKAFYRLRIGLLP